MSSPPSQADVLMITQFRPVDNDQWELTDDNIKRIDPETGQTILHNYCKYINTTPLEAFKYLIETKGCALDVLDKGNNTPIRYAFLYLKRIATGNNIAVLTYLLSQESVNVNAKGKSGYNLLHYACQSINTVPLEVFMLLIETKSGYINGQKGDTYSPLLFALDSFNPNKGGDINVLTYLINQENVNVHVRGRFGFTLLHHAYININTIPLDIFKALIETHGADVNALDEKNDAPIYHAIRRFSPNKGGDITVLHYLLTKQNVNVNLNGQFGRTLMHFACILDLSGREFGGRALSLGLVVPNAEADNFGSQIVEMIAERCVEHVLDGNTLITTQTSQDKDSIFFWNN
jgi:hypothetical protein